VERSQNSDYSGRKGVTAAEEQAWRLGLTVAIMVAYDDREDARQPRRPANQPDNESGLRMEEGRRIQPRSASDKPRSTLGGVGKVLKGTV